MPIVKIDRHIVLLCTGFHRRHYPNLDSAWKNPQVTVEATLAQRARIADARRRGTVYRRADREHVRAASAVPRPRHAHWEWLVNLEELVGKGEFQFFGVPLKLKGGSGSPVRAFAIVDEPE